MRARAIFGTRTRSAEDVVAALLDALENLEVDAAHDLGGDQLARLGRAASPAPRRAIEVTRALRTGSAISSRTGSVMRPGGAAPLR